MNASLRTARLLAPLLFLLAAGQACDDASGSPADERRSQESDTNQSSLKELVPPFVTADEGAISRLIVDGTQLFFSTEHTVYGAREDSEAVELLFDGYEDSLELGRSDNGLVLSHRGKLRQFVPRGESADLGDWFSLENIDRNVAYGYEEMYRLDSGDLLRTTTYRARDLASNVTRDIASSAVSPDGLVKVGGYLFLSESASGDPCAQGCASAPPLVEAVLKRVPVKGGELEELKLDFGSDDAFAFRPLGGDADGLLLEVYVLNAEPKSERHGIYRVPLDGGRARQLVQGSPLLEDAFAVKYAAARDRQFVYLPGDRSLWEIDSDEAKRLLRLDDAQITALAADDSGVYLAAFDSAALTARIDRLPRAEPGQPRITYGSCTMPKPLVDVLRDQTQDSLFGLVSSGGDAYYLRYGETNFRVVNADDVSESIFARMFDETYAPDISLLLADSYVLTSLQYYDPEERNQGVFASPRGVESTAARENTRKVSDEPIDASSAFADGDTVYYLTESAVVSLELATPERHELAPKAGLLKDARGKLVKLDDALFVSLGAQLARIPLDGGAPEPIDVELGDDALLLGATDDALIVANGSAGILFRQPVSGGAPEQILELGSAFSRDDIDYVVTEDRAFVHVDNSSTVHALAQGVAAPEEDFCVSGYTDFDIGFDGDARYFHNGRLVTTLE